MPFSCICEQQEYPSGLVTWTYQRCFYYMKDGLSNAGLVFSMIILGIWASSTLALCQISPIPLPLPQVLPAFSPQQPAGWPKTGGSGDTLCLACREPAKEGNGSSHPLESQTGCLSSCLVLPIH